MCQSAYGIGKGNTRNESEHTVAFEPVEQIVFPMMTPRCVGWDRFAHAEAVASVMVEVHFGRYIGLFEGLKVQQSVFHRHSSIGRGAQQQRGWRQGGNLLFVAECP